MQTGLTHVNETQFSERLNTRMLHKVKMTPLGSLLVRIISPACFQGKSTRAFSAFLGPNSVLEWRAFMSTLNMIF